MVVAVVAPVPVPVPVPEEAAVGKAAKITPVVSLVPASLLLL